MADLNLLKGRKKQKNKINAMERASQNEATLDSNNYINRNEVVVLSELESYIRKQDDEEAELFRESIETEGIREPLLLVNVEGHNNLLIDGHHRYRASENSPTVPVKYITTLDSLDEVKVWMLKNQLGRRNLKDFERIELSEKLLSFNAKLGIEKRVQNASKNESANLHFRNEDENASAKKIDHTQSIADTANTSRRNTAKALKIIREAPEFLKDQVRSGERSIHSVYQEITKRAKQNKEVLLQSSSLQGKLDMADIRKEIKALCQLSVPFLESAQFILSSFIKESIKDYRISKDYMKDVEEALAIMNTPGFLKDDVYVSRLEYFYDKSIKMIRSRKSDDNEVDPVDDFREKAYSAWDKFTKLKSLERRLSEAREQAKS